jgi:single-stranded DNA-binding protein
MSGIECAFLGTLARDVETRTSKNDRQYLRFTVRVGDGDAVQWVLVLVFDEVAATTPEKFTNGVRAYIEGSIRIEDWTAQDGAKRSGLSCMSWRSRLSETGRNRPKRDRDAASDRQRSAGPANDFHDDPIGF